MKKRFAGLTATIASIAGVTAFGIGAAQPPQATARNAVVHLWDQWTGDGAPWPRRISSDDNDYACLNWLSLGETGANDPSTQANASFFGSGGGSVMNGETVLSEHGHRKVRTRPSGRAVPTTARPKARVNVPSLDSTKNTVGVRITLRNGGRDVVHGAPGHDLIAVFDRRDPRSSSSAAAVRSRRCGPSTARLRARRPQ
jgi:hypothetical protein